MIDDNEQRVADIIIMQVETIRHTALRGGRPPPLGNRTSALGDTVRSFLAGSSGDFRIAIFRHTAARAGASSMLSLTAEALGPWIERTAQARLTAIGGANRLRACTQ